MCWCDITETICCCLWPLESHGRPEPRPPPAALRTSSRICSSLAAATGSSHRSRTVWVVITLGHVNRCSVVCSWDLQIGHIGEGLHPGSSLYKYEWRQVDFPAGSWANVLLVPRGRVCSALLMAGAGPDSILFGLCNARHSRAVIEYIVFIFLAMEVGVIWRSLSRSIFIVFPSQLENTVCFILLGPWTYFVSSWRGCDRSWEFCLSWDTRSLRCDDNGQVFVYLSYNRNDMFFYSIFILTSLLKISYDSIWLRNCFKLESLFALITCQIQIPFFWVIFLLWICV